MNLPFKMRQETPMEKYRAETFWTKEPETIAWIRSFDPHDVFFDVGANIGVYSLYAASLYPMVRVFSFEPMRQNYVVLIDNINENDLYNIAPLPLAIGSESRTMRFVSEKEEAGASGGQISESTSCGGDVVQVLSIDSFLSAFTEAPKPDHIKIDIDGQELQVILGMRQTLPHIKSALIEVSSKSKHDVVGIMTAAGFTTDNRFNKVFPHSSDRRKKEGIDAENIVFTRN